MADDFSIIEDNADRVAGLLKVMAHPLRLLILCHLRQGELTVHQLEEAVGTSQSNLSQHLAKLRLNGLLVSRKEGNQVFYSIKEQDTITLLAVVKDTFCREKDKAKGDEYAVRIRK